MEGLALFVVYYEGRCSCLGVCSRSVGRGGWTSLLRWVQGFGWRRRANSLGSCVVLVLVLWGEVGRWEGKVGRGCAYDLLSTMMLDTTPWGVTLVRVLNAATKPTARRGDMARA